MKKFVIAAALVISAMPLLAAEASWQDRYLDAMENLEQGQFAAAVENLDKAIAAQPEPMLAGNDSSVDYLPYINLAAAYHELGDNASARDALDKSYRARVATRSYIGSQVWDEYALKIMAGDEQVVASAAGADFRDFERSGLTLSDEQAVEIKQQVLRRCALTGKGPTDMLPWYFHYEYGLELMDAGDAQRAVDELILAANKREESRRNSRMYGMWFTNYLPYYQIALAHSKLGNWRCAFDAMRLSAQYGEFSPVDPGFEEYSDLQKLIMLEADKSG